MCRCGGGGGGVGGAGVPSSLALETPHGATDRGADGDAEAGGGGGGGGGAARSLTGSLLPPLVAVVN